MGTSMHDITTTFEWVRESDVYIARLIGALQTRDDVDAWYKAFVEHNASVGRFDAVLLLDRFTVDPSVATYWCSRRDYIRDNLMRDCIRVASPADDAPHSAVQQVTPGTLTQSAPTIGAAIGVIESRRPFKRPRQTG